MQQPKNYQKISMLLKGQDIGILELEQRQSLHYELHCNHLPKHPRLLFFFSEDRFLELPNLHGETSEAQLKSLKAVALLSEGHPFMKAKIGDFHWAAALSALQPQSVTAAPIAAPSSSPSAAAKTAAEEPPCRKADASNISNPFPGFLENTVWKRVEYPYFANGRHYLTGEIFEQGILRVTLLAVPGEYAVNPPPWLKGFDYFLNNADGSQGYWLFAKDFATGKPLSIQSIAHTEALG